MDYIIFFKKQIKSNPSLPKFVNVSSIPSGLYGETTPLRARKEREGSATFSFRGLMSRNMVPSSSRRSTNDGGREQSMGSSSSHPSTSNRGTGQRSAAGAAEPLIQRSWHQTSSSNQDKRNIQRAYQQQPMRPGEANVVTATERFSQMAISDHTARRTEPLHNRSKNEQMASATHKGDSSTSQKETGKADAHLSSGDLYDKECPICLEEYEPANTKVIFRCRHHYHFQCILQWMAKRITCPICNQALVVSFSRR